jgi:GNAT superfamily N-acetyltransferase
MHKDLNITRAIDFDHKITAAKRKYVDEPFGTNQLYLEMLGTNPHYQSRGAGTRLVTSGLEVARSNHVNVTLIAQPTAEVFYLHLGFTSVANISIPSVDNDESFRFNVMVYDSN